MRHEWKIVTVDGFEADEVDFANRLLAAGQSARNEIDDLIIGPLVNASNEGATLIIEGHADRIDSNDAHRTSLELETAASTARAHSALETLLTIIREEWLEWVTEWNDLPYVAAYVKGLGATHLADPDRTADARRRNRRVRLLLCRNFADE